MPSKMRSKGPYCLAPSTIGCLCRRYISRAKFFDEVCVQIRLGSARERGHVQTPQAQNQRGQQTDGAGAHDRSLARPPHFQPALNLVSLVDSFLHHGGRLEQHADVLESLRHLHDELDIIDVVFRQIPVAQVDAALVVRVVGGHVVGADQVIDALAGAAHGGDDVVAGLHFGDIRPDGFDLAEALVADDQEVVSGRRRAVFGGVDFFVGSVHADAQNLYQHATAVGNLIQRRLRQIGHVDAVGFSWEYTDRFHFHFSL